MAYSPANSGSTPSGYMTPEQINQMYQYSGALTKGGMRDEEITSPWQGARMMADALAGRSMRNQAGAAQQQNSGLLGNLQTQAAMQSQPGGPGPSMTPGTPPQMQPPPLQHPITPTPPVRPPPAPMSGAPIPGLSGSVPSGMPGGMPGGPGGMVGGMQPPPNPMMQALMSQPPGQGMA